MPDGGLQADKQFPSGSGSDNNNCGLFCRNPAGVCPVLAGWTRRRVKEKLSR